MCKGEFLIMCISYKFQFSFSVNLNIFLLKYVKIKDGFKIYLSFFSKKKKKNIFVFPMNSIIILYEFESIISCLSNSDVLNEFILFAFF